MPNRLPFMPREKAAYIKLKRLGYSINMLSKLFGRSTSVIYRVLSWNQVRQDLRKLPSYIKRQRALMNRLSMGNRLEKWLQWAEGKGEKPP